MQLSETDMPQTQATVQVRCGLDLDLAVHEGSNSMAQRASEGGIHAADASYVHVPFFKSPVLLETMSDVWTSMSLKQCRVYG